MVINTEDRVGVTYTIQLQPAQCDSGNVIENYYVYNHNES